MSNDKLGRLKKSVHAQKERDAFYKLEKFLKDTYQQGNIEKPDHVAWISPSGLLLGNTENHYQSAIAGLKHIGIVEPDEYIAITKFQQRSGCLRMVVFQREFSVDIHGKVFPDQLRTIRHVATKYPFFFFDIYEDGVDNLVGWGSSVTELEESLKKMNRLVPTYYKRWLKRDDEEAEFDDVEESDNGEGEDE